MKSVLRLLLMIPLLLFISGCKSNKEEDPAKENFSNSEDLGIYQNGQRTFHCIKNIHQYYCNPKDHTLRIIDHEGTYNLTIKLSAMPSVSGGVSGTVSGNMGLQGFSFSELCLFKNNNRTVWLWSDKDKVGFVLPSVGMLTSDN